MTQRGRAANSEAGFALLIVLWTLVLISLLFVMLATAARSDAQLTANLRGAAELEAVADGAIHTTVFELMQGARAARDSMPAARRPGTRVEVDVASQSGLVNPNVASPELLRALLIRLGADPARADRIAAAIVDWRTPGRRSGQGGAKAEQYGAAGLDYGPPGAPFETVGELRGVLGMTSALLAALEPHLTLYWDGEPDPGLADPAVRAALHDVGIVRRAGQTKIRVVRISATACRPDGTRATRRAVIRIGPSPNRRGWRVLLWSTSQD